MDELIAANSTGFERPIQKLEEAIAQCRSHLVLNKELQNFAPAPSTNFVEN
ncbi:hypothetical protein NKH81_23830 [Mesorhizobium sp. M0959]|uniref:hypothetical protein n=1 Tax=Mesorhizobium sp. M0959 TaxID=2957034 RepID=UPI00333B704F